MRKNKQAHILVIRLSAMGDVAMTIPVLLALRRTHPEVSISILTKPFFTKILQPLDVQLIPAEVTDKHKGIAGLWALSRILKAAGFTAVADLHNVLRTKILKFFLASSDLPFVQIDKGRNAKKALTRPQNKIFKALPSTFERYAEVLGKLGYPIELQPDDVLAARPIPEEIRSYLGEKEGAWLGIAPFAAHQGKQYPLDMMEEVVGILAEESGLNILLFGAPGREAEILSGWEKKYSTVFSMAGHFDFENEIACISNLDCMLAMDSGNAHIAAAYGVPTVTLWGVTHPYAGFAPFGQEASNFLLADRNKFPLIPTSVFGNKHPDGYERAMETIPVARVVTRIREILA